jgi:hypothetical protein
MAKKTNTLKTHRESEKEILDAILEPDSDKQKSSAKKSPIGPWITIKQGVMAKNLTLVDNDLTIKVYARDEKATAFYHYKGEKLIKSYVKAPDDANELIKELLEAGWKFKIE